MFPAGKVQQVQVQNSSAVHWKSATCYHQLCLKWESGLFQRQSLTPCVLYYLIFRGWFMALTQATLLSCLYLLKIKENHGFITQTEWVCLHSKRASLDSCNRPALHIWSAFFRGNKLSHVQSIAGRTDVKYKTVSVGTQIPLVYSCCWQVDILPSWLIPWKKKKPVLLCLDYY